MLQYRRSGVLTLNNFYYFLAPTRKPGVYANTFGLGAGLLALPVLAAVNPWLGPLQDNPGRCGKWGGRGGGRGGGKPPFSSFLRRWSPRIAGCILAGPDLWSLYLRVEHQ